MQEAAAAQAPDSKNQSKALILKNHDDSETLVPIEYIIKLSKFSQFRIHRVPPLPRDPSPKSLLPEDLFVVEVNQPVTEVLAAVQPPQTPTSSGVELPSDTSTVPSVPATPEAFDAKPQEHSTDANNNNEGVSSFTILPGLLVHFRNFYLVLVLVHALLFTPVH